MWLRLQKHYIHVKHKNMGKGEITMFEVATNKMINATKKYNQKVYQCECCGRLESPWVFGGGDIIRNYEWKNTSVGWICKNCYENPPQSEEEQIDRYLANHHHNLVIKNKVLRSQYGDKYRRIFAACGR